MAGLLGSQDGCFGSAVGRAMTHIGMVPYSIARPGRTTAAGAKEWGRLGAPDDLVAEAAAWKLGAAVLLNSTDEMLGSLQAGKPCTICTAHGFTMVRGLPGILRESKDAGAIACSSRAYRSKPPGFLICHIVGAPISRRKGRSTSTNRPGRFWVSYSADIRRSSSPRAILYALSGTPEFGPAGVAPPNGPGRLKASPRLKPGDFRFTFAVERARCIMHQASSPGRLSRVHPAALCPAFRPGGLAQGLNYVAPGGVSMTLLALVL